MGEHTRNTLRDEFLPLNPDSIERLISFPTLFAYEGETENVRVGYVREIRDSSSIYLEYEFDPTIREFPFSALYDHKFRLDIGKWEMNRTHWAIKEGDLFEILLVAGVIDETFFYSSYRLGKLENLHHQLLPQPVKEECFQQMVILT